MSHHDHVEGLLDDVLRAGAGAMESFLKLPSVPVPQTVTWAVDDALQRARAAGLRFPRPEIRFVDAPGRSRGQFEQRANDARHVLTLNVATCVGLRVFREVVYHEAQHMHDCAAGTFGRMSVPERERRAIAFSARMMASEPRP